MTDRDISGEVKRSSLNRLPALLGINGDSLKEIAERVRQFDKSQSDETRQRKALEKVVQLFGQSTLIESGSEKHAREDYRKREVEALELMAVAQAYAHPALQEAGRFKTLMLRLGLRPATREQNEETRND